MGKQPEAQLSEKIAKALKKEAQARGHDLFIFKVHGHEQQMSGVPDLLACYRGRFIGFEVKMPGNSLSPRQVYVKGLIEGASGVVVVPYSVAEALDALDLVDGLIDRLDGHTAMNRRCKAYGCDC